MVYYYFLSFFESSDFFSKISAAAPIAPKVEVASNGINILFASPFATSYNATKDFN